MPELTEVVKAALDAATAEPADAGESGDADATPEADTSAESETPAADSGVAPEAAAEATATGEGMPEADKPAAETAPPSDDLAREMEALGLKHVAGKDNRIPYSRVMKIVDNARKRAAEEHAKAQEQSKKDYEAAQQELQNFRAVDQLIQSDPERYLTLLSGYVPAYQRYLQQQRQEAAQPPTLAEKMPEPDTKFPDGS